MAEIECWLWLTPNSVGGNEKLVFVPNVVLVRECVQVDTIISILQQMKEATGRLEILPSIPSQPPLLLPASKHIHGVVRRAIVTDKQLYLNPPLGID
ncbi:MAG: hypothetical protein LUC33_02555 [Prevotellaceae bacterium]|nr:hypothetical protein [Prevotellaceae bacterium]